MSSGCDTDILQVTARFAIEVIEVAVLRTCESGWRHKETPAEIWSFDSRSFIISEALWVLETWHTVIVDGILDVELRMISDNWL